MKPVEVDNITMAFPASVSKLIPAYSAIPDEFKNGHTIFNRFFNEQFFGGVKVVTAIPKDGIDAEKAWRHYRAIAGSFEPKHEHKEAACAYLLSQWFDELTWEKASQR